jgi:site-specific DNA-methyltransferase (cytosine-N4-specific)
MLRNQIELPLPPIGTEAYPHVDDWTFNGASTRELTHCYHDYPARMIPQIASKLLDQYGKRAKLLFDPYCGTGTSLVEAIIRGISAVGTDLNPLARLIAESKTTIVDIDILNRHIRKLQDIALRDNDGKSHNPPATILGVSRLEFWFKPEVTNKLWSIREYINKIPDDHVQMFFKVAFSETVREVSNTRTEEFKLFRYAPDKLKSFNPNVYSIMLNKLNRNKIGLGRFMQIYGDFSERAKATICEFNSMEGIPSKYIRSASVDIVITSPPYGDSHTTVAYGQYSRLSAAWLSLVEPEKIDGKLMGGKIYKELPKFNCSALNASLKSVADKDTKRALEVASFYTDLQKSISNVAKTIRKRGYSCYVVGNRRVKGVSLPTDKAIVSFFEAEGFHYEITHTRSIPNKRMPHKNSPSNIQGELDTTMVNEYIVVMQKI